MCVGVGVTHIFSDAAVIYTLKGRYNSTHPVLAPSVLGEGLPLSYSILGIDSWPGIQPHIWLIYIWRMRDIWRIREQLIPGRLSEAFNRPENKAMSAVVLHVHCNTTAHSLHYILAGNSYSHIVVCVCVHWCLIQH